MNGAQITMVVLQAVALLVNANIHGKPRTGKHSFWITLTSCAISFAILYWGGFWSISK